jgi:hypothetical protein
VSPESTTFFFERKGGCPRRAIRPFLFSGGFHNLPAGPADFEFLTAAHGRNILSFVMGTVDPQLEDCGSMPPEK